MECKNFISSPSSHLELNLSNPSRTVLHSIESLKERRHSFTVQIYCSVRVPTTATVFAIPGPQPRNSHVLCSLHDKICKLLLAILNFSFPLKAFHLLNLKSSHPSCKLFSSCILQSLTFIDTYSQPQRTWLIFFPFSPLPGLSLRSIPSNILLLTSIAFALVDLSSDA